jgi:hypothetical protein
MSENGPDVTIIDCEGSETEYHRGFFFYNGEDSTSVLMGFTITNGYADRGGGLHTYYNSPTIINCTFSNNNASNSGGGMLNDHSSPTITNCTFSQNYAYWNAAGMYNDNSNPTITDCTFIGNLASWFAGGMYNSESNPTITNCRFIDNSAHLDGGMSNYMSNPTITNCIFSGNSVSGFGAGMANLTNSVPTITNCLFSGNEAIESGGGMYNNDSDPLIVNCTFAENSVSMSGTYYGGDGMYNEDSSPMVTNCIFWDETTDEIKNVFGSNPTLTYCNVQGGYPGAGNIDADPMFTTNPYHGFDYLLRPQSPCIDSGRPSLEDGINWPEWYDNGPRSDMGAYGGPGNVGWLH